MRRGVRRAPSRKRKLGGRDKGGPDASAVNPFFFTAWFPYVWAVLKLREMVRSGSRPGQVISAGRCPGSKLTHGKKGTHSRKTAHLNADSTCPVYSDSESQTEAVQGLDGCASLLRDILKNENPGSEIMYLENRCNARPLEGKNCRAKKKGPGKHTPSVVRKEKLSSENKKWISNEACTGSERDTSDIAQHWSLQDHYRMYSPIIYQALCEHVQTQMSLMNTLASKNAPNGMPTACHTVSGLESQTTPYSGYGCYASPSLWSPQQPSCPLMVHSEVQTDGDNHLGSQDQTSSVNCPDIPRNSVSVHSGILGSLPHIDKAAVPTPQQLSLANWILPQQRAPKEADLLKCFQTHMSLFPAHGKDAVSDSQAHQSPTQLQPAFLATNEEKCARELIGEATSEGKYLSMHVQDAKIAKNVQQAENVSHTAEKVRIAKCLLGELKALVTEQEDSEVERLVTEIEACISGFSAVSGHPNVEVEIALALQPLRSENAQLRRQLRILNQHLREEEKTPKAPGNLELFSLQSLNMSLQSQLQESLKSQELLQSKNEELLKVIENQRDENKRLTTVFKDKEKSLLQNKQQFDSEMTRVKIELEEALANEKNSQFKLETAEKENQILGITLRQRDAEVAQLRELTRTLQNSMAKLLSDLSVDSARCKMGSNLTKSLLNIYDQQLQQDPAPPHTSVMSYLNKLETNHSFAHSELLTNEEATEPHRLCEKVLPLQGPPHRDTRAVGGGSAPGMASDVLVEDSDTECETIALIEDECNVDSTLYIPFARSTSKKHSPLSERLSPQPMKSVATTQLSGGSTHASKREHKPCAPLVCSSRNEGEDAPGNLSRTSDTEDMQLLRRIKEAIDKIPGAAAGGTSTSTEHPKEQATHHGLSACRSPGVPVRGNIVSDVSFLNSDLTSDWSISSFSTFTSHDEQDFRNGLAALDANIARLQKSLRTDLLEK
ncbi:coiled-coil domain-containing protein 14 [Phodopus roborovskii]|uniref:Ccdc14 protein n=1 Tax=Phodopus roborovskii TaxID=109678 RepID=A0AAU9ZI42_PHORO|nr:coiled-coil domain-containing protein 14 [Phodopus roborovskii]CAH6792291.1 Ccdc14 [Phodopus roborovskii]